MNFKLLLWKLGLRKSCPYCKGELLQTGYKDKYKCKEDNCKFNRG